MSRLSQLMGKKQVFKIGNLDLEFYPLTMKETTVLKIDENAPMEEQMKQTKELIDFYLKKAVPDATEGELDEVSVEYMVDLMSAITKVNKLDDVKSSKIKELVESKQKQIASK